MAHVGTNKYQQRGAGRAGFTLIELSIVLVIIGLIVGGVLVGRDLITAAEIRSQIKQIEEFKLAANAFKIKYGYLPGDIPPTQTTQLGFFTFSAGNAGRTVLIGNDPTNGPRISGYGNQSGYIDNPGEQYVFWQHLSEAGMVAGSYGGSVGSGKYIQPNGGAAGLATTSDYGIFMPTAKFTHDFSYISVITNNYFVKLKMFSNTSTLNNFQFYATAMQMHDIDTKIDDGLPDFGIVRENSTSWGSTMPSGFGVWAPSICVPNTSPKYYDLNPTTANNLNACQIHMLW